MRECVLHSQLITLKNSLTTFARFIAIHPSSMNTPHAPRATSRASPLVFYISRFTSHVTRHPSLVPCATLLLAFFLRVYRLADKNIWWDEGWSIWLAKQDFIAIALRTAMDEHPPLHYWMLKIWIALFGSSAYAGRYLSVAFGVLTVALIYRIGKRVGGSWVGILAAFILAISRFHIWWSQDIKNYTPSIFFAFLAIWFAMALIADGKSQLANGKSIRVRYWLYGICYSLFATLAIFTHYLAALVLLALNVYALIVILSEAENLTNVNSETLRSAQGDKPNSTLPLPRSRVPLLTWLVSNGLAVALFAPWLNLYLQNAQSWVAQPGFDFGTFLKLVATVLPLGVTTDIDNYFWLVIAFTTLALLSVISGLWSVVRKNSRHPLPTADHPLLFALIVLLPSLLLYALSLTPAAIFAPKIQARYLVILAPAYAILLALGINFLSRFSRTFASLALLFLSASTAFVLRDYYAERRLTDEYATLANNVNAFARQGDLVLLDTDREWPTFLYYLRARLDWLGVPNGAAMTDSDADLLVRRALNRNGAIWLVTIPDVLATDPQKILETRLARALPKRFDRTYGDKRIALYAPDLRDLTQVTQDSFSPQYKFNSGDLLGFDLPIREAKAGDTVRVVTYWNAPRETQVGIVLGQVSVTEKIGTGERVRVESALLLPPDAAGELPLAVNQNEIARIRVEPRTTSGSVATIAHRTDYRLGDAIHLVGYDLPITTYRGGDQVQIILYWLTDAPIGQNYVVFAHLLGNEFNAAQTNFLWGQLDRMPSLPVTAWLPNQTVADSYRVPIAPNAPAGKYKIEIGMYDAVTGARLKLSNGLDSIILTEIEIVR